MPNVTGQPGHCSTCHARILWVKMASGKLNPVDAEPVASGNVVIDEDGQGVVLKKDLFDAPATGPRYVSHFATCPDAAKFRKRK